jgi:senataxin
MPYENPAVEEVEAVLRDARTGKKQTPSDSDLFPVYNYVFPPKETSLTDEGSSSTSSSSLRHFYCSKCPNSLYREAATYLLFLFAFRRDGMPKRFLGELERTFDACTGCSRAFGGIRRRFGTR